MIIITIVQVAVKGFQVDITEGRKVLTAPVERVVMFMV
jgi:hypothetical protein